MTKYCFAQVTLDSIRLTTDKRLKPTVACDADYVPAIRKCLKLHNQEASFDEASETCKSEGATLLTLESPEALREIDEEG